MSGNDRELLTSMAEEIASLPPDDPLHKKLGERPPPGLDLEARAREAEELRETLADLAIPDMEIALLSVPDARTAGRNPWRPLTVLFAAAAAVFAILWLYPADPAPTSAPKSIAATQQPAEVMAVKFWHQTCPACREIDPRYAEVRRQFGSDRVLFVTFDMSTEQSRAQSKMLADRLGIRDLYEDNFGVTGYVVLVDAESKGEIGRLTTKHDTDTMSEILAGTLTRPRS